MTREEYEKEKIESEKTRDEKEVLYEWEVQQIEDSYYRGFKPVGLNGMFGIFPAKYESASDTSLRCAALVFMGEEGFRDARAYYDYWLARVNDLDYVRLFGFIVDIQIARAKAAMA